MRSRNIKPGFFKNDLLVELPFEYRLLFVGLWTMADREGRLEDRPTKIKMELFPADSVDVDSGLQALHDNGFVQRYESDGKRFIQVLAWGKHQNPHMKEAKSTIPAPGEHGASTVQALTKADTSPADSLIPDSLIPREEQKATVRKSAQYDEAFELSWAEYPKRGGGNSKAEAAKAWGARIRAGESVRTMADGVIRYAKFIRATGKEETEYVKQAASFFGPNKHYLEDWIPPRPAPQTVAPSKTLNAIQRLEAMKNGLGDTRDHDGFPETPLLGSGAHSGH